MSEFNEYWDRVERDVFSHMKEQPKHKAEVKIIVHHAWKEGQEAYKQRVREALKRVKEVGADVSGKGAVYKCALTDVELELGL